MSCNRSIYFDHHNQSLLLIFFASIVRCCFLFCIFWAIVMHEISVPCLILTPKKLLHFLWCGQSFIAAALRIKKFIHSALKEEKISFSYLVSWYLLIILSAIILQNNCFLPWDLNLHFLSRNLEQMWFLAWKQHADYFYLI